MAANDITVGLGFDVDKSNLENIKKLLEDLKKSAEKVPLGSETSEKINKHFSAAEKALAAGDWDSLRTSFNKITKILTQTLAATGNISEALQKSIDLKNTLEKQLNQLKEREAQIRSKYTKDMSHFLKSEADSNYRAFTKDEGKIIGNSGNALSRDEALSGAQKVNEELERLGKNITQVNNDIAQRIGGFASRQDFFKANRYAQQEPAIQAADKNELKVLEENQKDLSKDIAQVEQDIVKLKPASEEAAKGLEELYKQIVNISSQLNKGVTTQKNEVRQATAERAGGGAAKAPEEFASVNKGLEKQSSTLGKVFKQWTLYNVALRSVKKAMREAVKTIKDLDKALTEQAMVTGLTRKQAYSLLGTYQDMAKSLGATTKEVASTMTAFLRQGRSIADSVQLSEAAIAAAKVASISTADSVNYLTTAINGFRLSAEDAMKVSDKFAAVAATAATSYEEIAIAMSKVAAQANLAGMSIDYTTALLTKGLETTREAPETIGTALKTVIARMRELTDYGATLEDGMNINNVEKQLSYVGIELRKQNGELRSTEDVLDDLGQKWDTLSSNQQAAIAKALAGTRQQSRLIAMMQDYDRVIELQEIAERSQGATLAQMSTYLEGMDAALNRVNIAWEEIVSTLADSEVIIGLINFVSSFLDKLGTFLQTDFGVVTTLTTISILTATIIGNKIREHQISKAQRQIEHQLAKDQNIQNRLTQEGVVQAKALVVQKLKERLQQLDINKKTAQKLKMNAEAMNNAAAAAKFSALIARYEAEEQQIQQTQLPQAEAELELEDKKLTLIKQQGDYLASQDSMFAKLSFGLSGIISLLAMGVMLYKAMAAGIGVVITLTNKEARAKMKAAAAEKIKTAWTMAGSAAAIPVAGWVIAAAILAALGVAAIVMAVNMSKSSETTEDNVKKMSAEIYKLSEKGNSLQNVIDKFEDIDNQVLRTNDDLKQMDELLNSITDSLSEEEQEKYKSLQTDKQRLAYLKELQAETEKQLREKRNEQRKELSNISAQDIKDSLTLTDSLYALNNSTIYDVLDDMDLSIELSSSTRKLTESLLSEMSVETQKTLLNNTQKIQKYTETMSVLAETLSDTNLTLKEQAQAYKKAYLSLSDAEARAAFEKANESWLTFSQLSENALDYIDEHYSGSINGINQFTKAIQDLGYSSKESLHLFEKLTLALNNGSSLQSAVESVFGITKESGDKYKNFINSYEKAFGTGLLNIGQNIKAFQSTVDNFYENVTKWNSLDDVTKTQFIKDNAEMFTGEQGKQLTQALETGNFAIIQDILSKSDYLEKERQRILNQIEDDLEIERAKEESEQDKAAIRYLEIQKEKYSNLKNLTAASLETRLKQEQEALSAYKNYLSKEQEALEDSLNKRKEAYQKYFEAVNQAFEDQEYEDQAQLLVTNLTKLSSSDSATSQQKTLELTKQLEELEKERLQTLRERAQEQVLNNIDTEISDINKKFDELLNSQQLMLQAMLDDTSDTSTFATNYLGRTLEGASFLEAQSALDTFRTTFGSYFNGLDDIRVTEDSSGNVYITIGDGEPINLTNADGKDIIKAVQDALKRNNRSVGLGRR